MKTNIKKQETSPMHVWSRFITVVYGSNRYDSHVNRLETCRLTSVVVHIRLCYIYAEQIEDVHDIKLFIHNASLE